MGRIYLGGFGFKIQVKTIKREKKKSIIARTAYCHCIKENDIFYADVYLVRDSAPEYIRMLFTPESYELKGRTNVFSKVPDESGKYINYMRDKQHAENFPGIDRVYTTLCHDQVFKGKVIERNKQLYFDMSEYIGAYSFFHELVEVRDNDNRILSSDG